MSENNNKMTPSEAAAVLWQEGILHWMLHSGQKELYDSYVNCNEKTVVWNCSRRLGKSFTLCVIAIETCLRIPNSLVKYCCGKQVDARSIIRPLIRDIITSCPPELRPVFKVQERSWVFPNGSRIELTGLDGGRAESIRGGACLEKGTLIMTPNGNVPIENLRPGDEVYGYNKDGSVSKTKVVELYDNGEKEVTEVLHNGKKILASTDDHRWLTRNNSNCFIKGRKENTKEKEFREINTKNDRIVRRLVDIPCGDINEPHAYAIGAFIGDGNGTKKVGTALRLASKDSLIPDKVAKILNVNWIKNAEYSYHITTSTKKYKHSKEIKFNYYKEWIKGKYWHEKTFDWNTVDKWDRDSCLDLLAGLIDTDGSVHFNPIDNNIEIQYHSQSSELIKNLQKLVFKLFQCRAKIDVDNRVEKYTHPMFKLRIRSTVFSKRILKELGNKLVRPNKQYKPEYDHVTGSEPQEHIKFSKGNRYKIQVYDIEVANETHLFLTADGLVTHNCHLGIIDEAGFVSDLKYIISSILMPTTITTKGKIILASTPPKSAGHAFVEYVNVARIQNNLCTKTIYDNPLIDQEELQKIIDESGGVESITFRREYMCEIRIDQDAAVVPEFTREVKAAIVKDWPRASFYDTYVSMDLGIKDLTVVLFAWYDFREAKIVIEDEFVVNGQRFNTNVLASGIQQKENEHFTDPVTGEKRPTYLRVSDNNLMVINDLYQLHGLRFIATRKDDADAALNNLRIAIQEERIIINPRCRVLITHLEQAVWNKARTSFDRSADNGHYDAVDALKYLIRNVQTNKNPYPASSGGYNTFKIKEEEKHPQYSQFASITNLPSSQKAPTKFSWFKKR